MDGVGIGGSGVGGSGVGFGLFWAMADGSLAATVCVADPRAHNTQQLMARKSANRTNGWRRIFNSEGSWD
jgi:hypothetical protein